MKNYIVDICNTDDNRKVYYCHHKDFPNIPVFGSIGSYKRAKAVCDCYNGIITKRQKEE